jgi:hypothetical protein
MKPNGLSMRIGSGGISMSVTRATAVEDAIWDAVEAAIAGGWDAKQFRQEAAEAWKRTLKDEADAAAKDLMA